MCSIETLIKDSDVLAYEWRMLRDCHEWLATSKRSHSHALYSAVVEATRLHIRLLIAFFYTDPPKQYRATDISLRSWFVPGSEEFDCLRDQTLEPTLDQELTLCHRRLAHLSRDRTLDPPTYDATAARHLNTLMLRFAELACDRIGPKLQELASQMRSYRFADVAVSTKEDTEVTEIGGTDREVL